MRAVNIVIYAGAAAFTLGVGLLISSIIFSVWGLGPLTEFSAKMAITVGLPGLSLMLGAGFIESLKDL